MKFGIQTIYFGESLSVRSNHQRLIKSIFEIKEHLNATGYEFVGDLWPNQKQTPRESSIWRKKRKWNFCPIYQIEDFESTLNPPKYTELSLRLQNIPEQTKVEQLKGGAG